MDLTSDLTLQFLSSVIMIFFLVTGVGYEIECVGTTESTDTLYISVRVTCTIKLNIKENFKIWMLSFLERSKYLIYTAISLIKKDIF